MSIMGCADFTQQTQLLYVMLKCFYGQAKEIFGTNCSYGSRLRIYDDVVNGNVQQQRLLTVSSFMLHLLFNVKGIFKLSCFHRQKLLKHIMQKVGNFLAFILRRAIFTRIF